MGAWVTRQCSCYNSPPYYVEIESSISFDNVGPDMLKKKYAGEGEYFPDYEEAVETAIAIRDAWEKDKHPNRPDNWQEGDEEPNIRIDYGSGHADFGCGMDEDSDEDLRVWAKAKNEKRPLCAKCGCFADENECSDRQSGQKAYTPFECRPVYWEEKMLFCSSRCAEGYSEQIYKDDEEYHRTSQCNMCGEEIDEVNPPFKETCLCANAHAIVKHYEDTDSDYSRDECEHFFCSEKCLHEYTSDTEWLIEFGKSLAVETIPSN